MIRIAVCDDEKYMADEIKAAVAAFFRRKNMEVSVSRFSSGEELLRHEQRIDILFLDMQMGEMDGMETARKLRGRGFQGFLINLQHLKSYKNGMAYMADGEEIPVSRLRSKEFSEVILQYMQEWRL